MYTLEEYTNRAVGTVCMCACVHDRTIVLCSLSKMHDRLQQI